MFPDRIEKAICIHPEVEECCAVGIPDNDRIHYPKALVVLKNEKNADKVREEILGICHQNISEYMIPEEIEFVNDLPRTSIIEH